MSTLNTIKPPNPPLGIDIKKLVPYNVIILSSKISEGKLLKQYLQSDLFNIVSIIENSKELVDIFNNRNSVIDIVAINIDNNREALNLAKSFMNIAPNKKYIIMTSSVTKDIILDFKISRINALILKPFSRSQIYDKFAEFLGRSDLSSSKFLVNINKTNIDLHNLSIPSVPSVLIEVMEFNENTATNGAQDLEKIILGDKALTLDIIKISNSAFYGRSGSIKELKEAITLLGLKTIKNLVVLQAKKKLTNSLNEEIFKKHLNILPIVSSLITIDLLGVFKLRKLEPGLFTMSVFRKIGMMVLAQNFPSRYKTVLQNYEEGIHSIFHLENKEFNSDSIEIGIKVFKKWNFPTDYIEIIGNQHFIKNKLDQLKDIDRVTYLGELIAKRLINLPRTNEESFLEMRIFDFYDTPGKARLSFNETYFEFILEHPFLA